jgi:hypothetical protein
MRFPNARFWTFLILSALATLRTEAQSFLKDSPISDSQYAAALRQYHVYVAPEVGLYRGIQYVDYDFTIQRGHPFYGLDSIRYGSVWYNGVGYDSVRMLYDLVKDQLVILDPYNVYKISLYMDRVDSFALDGHLFIRVRDSLAPPSLRFGYCEVIHQGRLVLLRQEQKFLRENLTQTSDNVRLYIDASVSYYLKKDGRYQAVKTRKGLFDFLKDRRRSDIKRIMRKSKLKWRKDREQLLQLVATWYDGANH